MNYEQYLDIQPEVKDALGRGLPVVALESTILSHGMPYPENLDFAAKVEEVVRAEGCVPATIALMGGRVKVGLSAEELQIMCKAENVGKVSRRDFPIYIAEKKTGATTVASTMIGAAMAGIKVFATGGIGGVHRGGEVTMDISADLQELAHTDVCVVCAGAKQIRISAGPWNTWKPWVFRSSAAGPNISPRSSVPTAATVWITLRRAKRTSRRF